MSNALDAFLGQKFCLAMTGRATRLSVYNGFEFRHLCLLTLEFLMGPCDHVPSPNRRHYWGSKRLPGVPVRIRLHPWAPARPRNHPRRLRPPPPRARCPCSRRARMARMTCSSLSSTSNIAFFSSTLTVPSFCSCQRVRTRRRSGYIAKGRPRHMPGALLVYTTLRGPLQCRSAGSRWWWLASRLTGVLLHLLLGRPHPRVFGVLGLALIFQPAFGVDCRPTAVPGGGNGLPVALV